ncbi:hypothetical protein N7G274_009674 [Stereocaulon virgatum]|uniref:Uncharacterized protein n=1 Tax=Stereocaulon virgatum TaxID=373712 RepID=A0ABR3ZXV9_9LECA
MTGSAVSERSVMVTIRDRRKDRMLLLKSLMLAKNAGKQVAQATMMAGSTSKTLQGACISRSHSFVPERLRRDREVPRNCDNVHSSNCHGLDPEYATIIIMDADDNQSKQIDDASPEA